MNGCLRVLFAALVLATCATYGGCWDWSYPEALLREDGPSTSTWDAAGDGPADAAADDAGDADLPQQQDLPPPAEGGVDTKPDTLKQCKSACSGVTPICDTTAGVCRPCASHQECADGLCALDGSCPPASKISYVDDSCGATQDGSKANPFCTIDDAVSETPHFILVRPGGYGQTVIDGNHEVHGESGAEIVSSSCPALTIDGVTAAVAGLVIKGGVELKGAAKATLVANTIGPSAGCVGVVGGGAKVILQRNFIYKNTPGGVSLLDVSYSIENNIIAQNGNSGPNWGGVKLKPKSPSTFINNTVADNVSKGSSEKEAGGVRCEAAASLVNTIFWGNTPNTTKTASDARQYSDACTASYSLEQLPGGATVAATNIAGPPGFVGGAGAAAYHLQGSSKAQNAGTTAGAPKVDYDNQPRDTKPDIGADELP